MVYVQDINGQPLMPTERHGKVRRLLKSDKAVIIQGCPMIIRLKYETKQCIPSSDLGVDPGYEHAGLSATTKKKVLYEADAELRTDIVNLISSRRENRRGRRGRKTRYREPRFNNRRKSKKEGWLPPSVGEKIDSQVKLIDGAVKLVPVARIFVEVASFDIQKIKNPDIKSSEYQSGERLYAENTRQYVLSRDNYTCRCCKGGSGDKTLVVHHIESRKTGGNAPNNLVTLCKTCHDRYHKGLTNLPDDIKRGQSFKAAACMNMMRQELFKRLKEKYEPLGIEVVATYGYITKNVRKEHGLPKEHYIDARCISGNPEAVSDGTYYYLKKTRCHNRQIHKCNFGKGGIRKRNQTEHVVKGYRLFDKVRYVGKTYFVFGRRKSGFFDIRTLAGDKVNKGSLSFKKIRFLETKNSFLCERRQDTF